MIFRIVCPEPDQVVESLDDHSDDSIVRQGALGTTTTETIYQKVIVPELRRGAEVMDRLFI